MTYERFAPPREGLYRYRTAWMCRISGDPEVSILVRVYAADGQLRVKPVDGAPYKDNTLEAYIERPGSRWARAEEDNS